MSQFSPALSFLLANEDRLREYAAVPDVGGCAIAGINSASFPADYAKIVRIIPNSARASAVAEFYQSKFWTPMNLGGLDSQDLANRVLDEGVNAGAKTAINLLQRAVNALRVPLEVDGQMGPITLSVVNGCDPEAILAAFRQQRLQRYREIVVAKPEDARYLPEWEKRALR